MFEAFKGALVLAAASGLLSLVHQDVHAAAAALIAHLHLTPAAHYLSIFLDADANVHDSRLLTLAAGATVYALVRFVEAYGLFGEKAWVEVLAAANLGHRRADGRRPAAAPAARNQSALMPRSRITAP